MKKILIALFVLCCIIFISVCIIIKPVFYKVILINTNQINANKYLTDENNWSKWWPNKDSNSTLGATHTYNKNSYSVIWKLINGDSILIKNNAVSIKSVLSIFPVNGDTVAIEWKGSATGTGNPIKNFKNYLQVKKIEKDAGDLLQNMKAFLESNEKIYGLRIDQLQVKDTLLAAIKYSSKNYPSTSEIYDLINKLKNYISAEGAIETDYPMLHVIQGSGYFATMVAIPVNKLLPTKNNFLFRRMVPGKILVTDVKGGPYTADHAVKQLELFMNDYHLVAPAIPFQSLVTDRSKEPDTTKWITRIYYPVM